MPVEVHPAERISPVKSMRQRVFAPWAVVSGVALLAVSLVVLLYARNSDREGIEREVTKSLVQLVVVLILGAAVNEALKERERDRQRQEKELDREHQDGETRAVFREQVRRRVEETYQSAKKARAMLRIAGITPERLTAGVGSRDSDAMKAYRRELEAINEVQLDLEKIWRKLDCFQAIFSNTEDLLRRLKMMSGYLRRILDEYEENCNLLLQDNDSLLRHDRLSGLVASTKDSDFKRKFCDRYSEATALIRKDLLKPAIGGNR